MKIVSSLQVDRMDLNKHNQNERRSNDVADTLKGAVNRNSLC